MNSWFCFLHGRSCHNFLPTRVWTACPAAQTLSNVTPSVLRCDSFTLVCVTTDTNRLNTFSPQSFTHTGSANIPSLAILLAVAIPLLMSRALYEGGPWVGAHPASSFVFLIAPYTLLGRVLALSRYTLNNIEPFQRPCIFFLRCNLPATKTYSMVWRTSLHLFKNHYGTKSSRMLECCDWYGFIDDIL